MAAAPPDALLPQYNIDDVDTDSRLGTYARNHLVVREQDYFEDAGGDYVW